jgi:hypothetical protein
MLETIQLKGKFLCIPQWRYCLNHLSRASIWSFHGSTHEYYVHLGLSPLNPKDAGILWGAMKYISPECVKELKIKSVENVASSCMGIWCSTTFRQEWKVCSLNPVSDLNQQNACHLSMWFAFISYHLDSENAKSTLSSTSMMMRMNRTWHDCAMLLVEVERTFCLLVIHPSQSLLNRPFSSLKWIVSIVNAGCLQATIKTLLAGNYCPMMMRNVVFANE